MMNSQCLLLAAVAGVLFVCSAADSETNCTEFYRTNGPQLTPCKKEFILQNGQNYRITCRADTPIEFIQQEPPEEIVDSASEIILTNHTDENAEYKYEAYLDLKNIDRHVIGFYACRRKDSMVEPDVLEQLVAEPDNTADISYFYIYVNGTDSLFAPLREIVMGKQGYYVAECKTSTPDVEVSIYMSQIKTPKYIRYSPMIGYVVAQCSKSAYNCSATNGTRTESKIIRWKQDQAKPIIDYGNAEFLPGETFSLNCSANYTPNSALHLTWELPNDSLKIMEHSNNKETTGGIVYRNITIVNASKDYNGNYTCVANSHCGKRSEAVYKKFRENSYLNVSDYNEPALKETRQKIVSVNVEILSYPPATYKIYKGNTELKNNSTFLISYSSFNHELTFRVRHRNVQDSDIYTINITNGINNKTLKYDWRFKEGPIIEYDSFDKTCVLNTTTSVQCVALGYPRPNITWIFNDGRELISKIVENPKTYYVKGIIDIHCMEIGNIVCKASNEFGTQNRTRRLAVYEQPGGFGVIKQSDDSLQRFSENDNVSIKCVASVFNFTNVTWEVDGTSGEKVEHTQNQYSLVARLKINNVSKTHSRKYVCRGIQNNGTLITEEIDVEVEAWQEPLLNFSHNVADSVQTFQPININCLAEGIPRPEIKWYKDGQEFKPSKNDSNIHYENINLDYKTVNSSIDIRQMQEENRGEYECFAANIAGENSKSIILNLKGAAYEKYVIIIVLILFVLVILIIYLTCKVKKEKRFRKELAAAGLLYFKEGVTKSINPELGIDEQAELLPYNEKFEFPADKLRLGKQLGAGAFGIVYKAEARGIIHAEEDTPVAVKMVKKTADNMYIKALASELKIMVHLGKHINIVNLLGACTKNVGKRELVVIVEYCRFGNVHNYMQRHREVFIDQFSDSNKEKSFGKVNRGYDSSGSTGLQSDYGTANTQDTDHTFLTNNTNRTCRKNVPSQPTEAKASEGYVQPEWRSNYESDYSYDGRSPRPLTSRDLLAWAFQIARGMEYLASRKVLHGDLAARNILLADDNIVKICDFGLARSIYKNDEYQKKENSLLPVKWLAIECMTDRIFSTQSDVWSFGIVLWELFTLAKTPYPNMSPAYLLHYLKDGHRLEKPTYSDDRIYNLMKRCWGEKPTTRPSFTELQETLGTFLEDNVRNHYVDLNTAYMDGNTRPEGQEDYLAMVSAPDYNNMVTPSPHHYVNEVGDPRRFFPQTPTKVDEDGYLQMSPSNIFSPKSVDTKFDFEPRNFNTRPSEASSGGSELTPMLTLNNLPRSGSDSDHEGNISPFPNVCPRIEEEPDEVFDNKQSKNALNQNARNGMINATNPMYITTLDLDAEKKPIEYVNVVPNSLVK